MLQTELATISIGLPNILKGKPRYNPNKGLSLLKEAKKSISSFLAKESPDSLSTAPEFNWQDTKALLLDDLNPEEDINALIAAIPESAELAMDVVASSSRIVESLKATFPVNIRQTVLGDVVGPLSPSEVARYARRWNVAVDPMVAINDLASHSLSMDHIIAFEEYYPDLLAELRTHLLDTLITIKGKRDSWEMSTPKERLIKMFMGQEYFRPDIPTTLQSATSGDTQQVQTAPPPRSKPLKLTKTEPSSPGEKT